MDTPHYPAPFDKLSLREQHVLRLMLTGLKYKQIAHDMKISPKTVDTFRRRIMVRAGVDNLVALVLLAVSRGLIEPKGTQSYPQPIESQSAPWPEDQVRPAA